MFKSSLTAYTCYQPVIEFTRGALVESFHNGAIAVVDVEGRLVAYFGDPDVVAFLRSAAKPFIALSLVEMDGHEKYHMTPKELAITCASHLGMDIHVETLLGLWDKIGLTEDNLECGIQPVGDAETSKRMLLEGKPTTAIRHNCSGKHTGMMAQAKLRGLPIRDYYKPEHPVQETILENFAQMCDLQLDDVEVAIDGCSVPTFAVRLRKAALAFARLADPRIMKGIWSKSLQTIFDAMVANPDMVRGPGDFDTEAMKVVPGQLISKSAAEAFFGLAIAPGARFPNSPALGVAIKIGDGGTRADVLVAAEILRQLGVLGKEQVERLTEVGWGPRKTLKNFKGLVVGEARPCFDLKFT